jgi:hypothetical protein
MTQTMEPNVEAVLSKLAEVTGQLEGPQQGFLGTLVVTGVGDSIDDSGEASESSDVAASEEDVAAVAAKVYALRETMSPEEQQILDVIVNKALGVPEPEVEGHTHWALLTTSSGPAGLSGYYNRLCNNFNVNYGGRWLHTAVTTETTLGIWSTYRCWGTNNPL